MAGVFEGDCAGHGTRRYSLQPHNGTLCRILPENAAGHPISLRHRSDRNAGFTITPPSWNPSWQTSARQPDGGLVVLPDLVHHCQSRGGGRAGSALPSASHLALSLSYCELGGLLSYGVDVVENYRRAASYADLILKGAKPSELPVQAPVKFELVINSKTAKALGLAVPINLTALADEVIE